MTRCRAGACPREAHEARICEKLSSGRGLLEEGEGQSRPEDQHLQRPLGRKEFDARNSEELVAGALARVSRRKPVCIAGARTSDLPQGLGCELGGDTIRFAFPAGTVCRLLLRVSLRPVLRQLEATWPRCHRPARYSQLSTTW